MGNVRERKKRERRKRIQQAAVDLICKSGFNKTTISQIAEGADLGTGTLYNYFSSKEEILFSIIADRSIDFSVELDVAINMEDVVSSIFVFIDIYLHSFSVYNKKIWRELTGAALLNNISIFTLTDKVDSIFLDKLKMLIQKFQKNNLIHKDISTTMIVSLIYDTILFNTIKYISDEKLQLQDLNKMICKQVEFFLLSDLSKPILQQAKKY